MTGAGATVPGNTLAAPAGAGFSLRALSPPPMRPSRPLRIALALLTLVPAAFLGGCGTTRMEATWHGKDVGQLRFRSVLVVSLLQDEDYRRMSEAALRDAIKRVPVTTSFELVPVAADLKDRAAITKAIRERGIEGVVTMRLVDQSTRAVTGSPSAVAVASGQYSARSSTPIHSTTSSTTRSTPRPTSSRSGTPTRTARSTSRSASSTWRRASSCGPA